MSKFFNIALAQVASNTRNRDLESRKAENRETMDWYLRLISGLNPTVDLFVFPETFIAGFDPTNWPALAETIPGPSTDFFCREAKELGKWLCPGTVIEKREGESGAYNTALLISPAGEIVLKYSKVFVPQPFEPSLRGNEFPVYEIEGVGKIGIMVCADVQIPEPARNLALGGAEIILKPTCQGFFIGGLRNGVSITQARTFENQCFMVSVNQCAPEGMGHSHVCDPEGRVLEELESTEAFTWVTLNLDEVLRARQYGVLGCYPYLKMLRECEDDTQALGACYARGLANSPVFENLPGGPPKTPSEIRRFGDTEP
jgi:formamidase